MAVIRSAKPVDAIGIAAVHVQSWRSTYPGMLPDGYLVGLSVQGQAARWQRMLRSAESRTQPCFVLADPEPRIAGYACCGPQRTELPGMDGEFYALYLVEGAQGQGHGRRMMGTMANAMMAQQMKSAVVWVLGDNPSRWFYQRLGGRHIAQRQTLFAGVVVNEWAYGWADLTELARLSADPAIGE